jgi:hypothetical protein
MMKNFIRVWKVVLLFISMADSKFILYVRKFLKNPLLERKQVVSTTNTHILLRRAVSNVRVVA